MSTHRFPGCFESLESICDLVGQAAQAAGLDDDAVYAVQLAVNEACSNIIRYAYGGEGLGDITLTTQSRGGELVVTLQDHGAPFDPSGVPPPNLDPTKEEMYLEHLGLYWMRSLMDEVNFEFSDEYGNTLTMIKRRQADSRH
jgi:anti-sigma regulatory factor (Ser/Thr protein kinase)